MYLVSTVAKICFYLINVNVELFIWGLILHVAIDLLNVLLKKK